MAIEIPDYLLPSEGAVVPQPRVAAGGADDLPEIRPEDFIPVDEEEGETPDWRARWLAAIAIIRDADDKHQMAHIGVLARDERAARLVAAWPIVAPAFEAPAERDPSGPAQQILQVCWMKMWNPAVQVKNGFVQLLSASAGISYAESDAALKMAVQLRLIYPDGTLSVGAQRFVRLDATQAIMARSPRRPAPKEPPPKKQPEKPAGAEG